MINRSILIVCLMTTTISALILSACQLEIIETSPGGRPGTQTEGRCGDRICDDAEQQNTNLCPRDCAPTPGDVPVLDTTPMEEEEEELKCESQDWTLTIDGCGNNQGTEPSGDLCTVIEACITVDQNCQIYVTGSGVYKSCAYSSPTGTCTYDLQCPDFNMPISGEVSLFKEGAVLPFSEEVVCEEGAALVRIIADASNVYETNLSATIVSSRRQVITHVHSSCPV